MNIAIVTLLLAVAAEVGVPPYFALAIALEENRTLNPLAVNVNANGTVDRGVMQLNSSWFDGNWQDPEMNIRAGCKHIKQFIDMPEVTTYWLVAVCYNAGGTWLRYRGRPPNSALGYADRVIARWNDLTGGKALIIIERSKKGAAYAVY